MVLKSNLKCLYDVGVGVYLAPGNNPIPDEVYAVMAKVPDFQSKIKNGTFEIIQKPAAETVAAAKDVKPSEAAAAVAAVQAANAEKSPLLDVPEKKALASLADIYDVNILRTVAEFDPRPKVKATAQARMDDVRKAMEKDAQKDPAQQDV